MRFVSSEDRRFHGVLIAAGLALVQLSCMPAATTSGLDAALAASDGLDAAVAVLDGQEPLDLSSLDGADRSDAGAVDQAADATPDADDHYPGPGEDFTKDPKRRGTPFGPRCGGPLILVGEPNYLFDDCTVTAIGRPNTSHVFFVVDRLPNGVSTFYASLVLGKPIALGTFTRARWGAVEIAMKDGRKYSAGDLDVADGTISLTIEKAFPGPMGEYYLHGQLEVFLALNGAKERPHRLAFRLN